MLGHQLEELKNATAGNFAQVHSHLVTAIGCLGDVLAEREGLVGVEYARDRLETVAHQVARLRDDLAGGRLYLPAWLTDRGEPSSPSTSEEEEVEGRRGAPSPRKRGRSPAGEEPGPSSRARVA